MSKMRHDAKAVTARHMLTRAERKRRNFSIFDSDAWALRKNFRTGSTGVALRSWRESAAPWYVRAWRWIVSLVEEIKRPVWRGDMTSSTSTSRV
jgi:predicted membrane metal-binding protein